MKNMYFPESTCAMEKAEAAVSRFSKKVYKHFAKFIRKHLCQSLYLKKVAGLQLY